MIESCEICTLISLEGAICYCYFIAVAPEKKRCPSYHLISQLMLTKPEQELLTRHIVAGHKYIH